MIRHDAAGNCALFIGADEDYAAADFAGQYELLLSREPGIRSLAYAEQVHGDHAFEITPGADRLHFAGEGDALFTRAAGTSLLIRTADCIPILFWHPNGLIGAVHAGWRGLEKKILTKTLQTAGGLVEDLQFAVGPFIGGKSYEVGDDVAGRFAARFAEPKPNGKFLLNLKLVLEAEFSNLGIAPAQVKWYDTDTLASPQWYSARRGDKKRNLSLIWRPVR